MSIDERHPQRWRAQQVRRQLVRDVAHPFWMFSPRDGEDDETYKRRLARQNDLCALEADAREDVANDDDAMP
jgi:hypothetical protein